MYSFCNLVSSNYILGFLLLTLIPSSKHALLNMLGIPPEGCSSIHFERIMGKKNAERMLGKEGWAPTAREANEAGFVMEVVPHEQLMPRAQEIAEKWAKEGKIRSMIAKGQVMIQSSYNWRFDSSRFFIESLKRTKYFRSRSTNEST